MKKIMYIIAIVLVPFLGTAQIKSASLQASGLTCSMCSNSVLKSLKTVSSIKKIDSDVETSTFQITFKKGTDVDLDALHKAVVKAGFSVANLKFVANVNDLKVKNESKAVIDGKTFHFVNTKEKTLNGDVTFKLLDKNFVSAKEFKKNKDKLYSDLTGKVYNVTL